MRIFFLFLLTACSQRDNQIIIQNKGSDTLVNLAQYWAEEYKKINPQVSVAVSGGGSGTGIAALINGLSILPTPLEQLSQKKEKKHKKIVRKK